MEIIFHVLVDDYEVGEVEGFFYEDGTYIHSWCLNDANYRREYMNPLFKRLGFNVVSSNDSKLLERLRKRWLPQST